MMIIDSVYGLLPPTRKELLTREKKVQVCKERMGNKWLLANSIPRKVTK